MNSLMNDPAGLLAGQRALVTRANSGIGKAVAKGLAAEHKLLQLIPYDRIGSTTDIANAAVWLASDESDYITGATLFVDGGMMLYPGFRTGG
jgi:glucose 1-dehydrogenase